MVVTDGEGRQLIEAHTIAVSLNEARADDGELEALLHNGGGNAKTRGDILGAEAFLGMQLMKRIELVGGMHG
jgi:hypothetical protein